jgi:hypothetical protein
VKREEKESQAGGVAVAVGVDAFLVGRKHPFLALGKAEKVWKIGRFWHSSR